MTLTSNETPTVSGAVASVPDKPAATPASVPAVTVSATVPATGPQAAADAYRARNSRNGAGYSHYGNGANNGNYGNRGGYGGYASSYVPPVVKSAKQRAWEAHQEARASSRRPVSMTEKGMQTLLAMLTHARSHGTAVEKQFIARYIANIPNMQVDDYGNHWLQIGPSPKILWSSHTDTVHRKASIQKIVVGDGIVTAKDNNCLGADCTAGVWLMTEMIHSKVPGLYIFHREEEIGCRGSSYIAKNHASDLQNIKAAIAFDRRGTKDIITHMGDMCASNAFAQSLAGILNNEYLSFSPSAQGVCTDTINYTEIIPECSNISVGYYMEHNSTEFLSLGHLFALRDALIKADWSKLVISRKAGEGSATNWRRGRSAPTYAGYTPYTPPAAPDPDNFLDLVAYVKTKPAEVAELLDYLNLSVDDIKEMLLNIDTVQPSAR